MNKPEQCIFTNIPCRVDELNEDEELSFDSLLGRYRISMEGIYQFQLKKLKGMTPQGLMNCARRCLDLRYQNTNIIPVWVVKNELSEYQSIIETRNRAGKAVYVLCAFEDSFEESIDHSEKPYELLRAFGRDLKDKGAYSYFTATKLHQVWARIVDDKEYVSILKFLINKGYLAFENTLNFQGNHVTDSRNRAYDPLKVNIQITVEGWESTRIKQEHIASNKVFIATAFHWPKSEEVRIKAIEAIKEACNNLGYDADIVSQEHTENVTNRIMSEIRDAKFVVAELTFHNRGVYFESGYARGLGKNVFHVVREGFTSTRHEDDPEGKRIHFDIAQVLYRVWKEPEDLRTSLEEWINATIGRYGR